MRFKLKLSLTYIYPFFNKFCMVVIIGNIKLMKILMSATTILLNSVFISIYMLFYPYSLFGLNSEAYIYFRILRYIIAFMAEDFTFKFNFYNSISGKLRISNLPLQYSLI